MATTISGCMIVKDEEDCISNILNCLVKFCDEIIILDTGSTDKTMEIVQTFDKVKLYETKWEKSFSKARNESFSYATKDYIFWCDADDVISDENIQRINKLKQSDLSSFDYVSMHYMYNLSNNDSSYVRRDCLLKRANNYRWSGDIHECLNTGASEKEKWYSTDIEIFHHKTKNSSQRNLDIFRHMIDTNKEFTLRDLFYYGSELYFNSLYDEAIEIYNKCIERKDEMWAVDLLTLYLRMYDIYLNKKNDEEKAIRYVQDSLLVATPRADFCCALGDYFLRRRSYQIALRWYMMAYKNYDETSDRDMLVLKSYYTWYPLLQLCVVFWELGDKETAYIVNEEAAKYNPDYEPIILNRQLFENNPEIETWKHNYKVRDCNNYLNGYLRLWMPYARV
jgi:glycosyltransferase involved in cell wall biosynthesis